jgi:hypothetical protein
LVQNNRIIDLIRKNKHFASLSIVSAVLIFYIVPLDSWIPSVAQGQGAGNSPYSHPGRGPPPVVPPPGGRGPPPVVPPTHQGPSSPVGTSGQEATTTGGGSTNTNTNTNTNTGAQGHTGGQTKVKPSQSQSTTTTTTGGGSTNTNTGAQGHTGGGSSQSHSIITGGGSNTGAQGHTGGGSSGGGPRH